MKRIAFVLFFISTFLYSAVCPVGQYESPNSVFLMSKTYLIDSACNASPPDDYYNSNTGDIYHYVKMGEHDERLFCGGVSDDRLHGDYDIYTNACKNVPVCDAGDYFSVFNDETCIPVPICDANQTLVTDTDPYYCYTLPTCPLGQHNISTDLEILNCVCNSGVMDVNGTCVPFSCPSVLPNSNLPLFKQTNTIAKCNFWDYGDYAYLEVDTYICCYGQEGLDNNSTCNVNELEINGKCYPITPSDGGNETEAPPQCANDEYYDYINKTCTKKFPDDGDDKTPPGVSPDDGGGGDGGGGYDLNNSKEDLSGLLAGVEANLMGVAKNYVLLNIPIQSVGSCSNSLVYPVHVLSKSYTIDITAPMSKLEEFAVILKSLIIFLFGFSAVAIAMKGGD